MLEYPQGMPGKWDAFFQELAKGTNNISLNDLAISQPTKPLVLELACGRGEYAVGLGRMFTNQNFVGLDIKGNRMKVLKMFTLSLLVVFSTQTFSELRSDYPEINIKKSPIMGFFNAIFYFFSILLSMNIFANIEAVAR